MSIMTRITMLCLLYCSFVRSYVLVPKSKKWQRTSSSELRSTEDGHETKTSFRNEGCENRRKFFEHLGSGFVVVGTSSLLGMGAPSPAYATYGDVPKSQGFNYIDFLIEKNASGLTPEGALYNGAASVDAQLRRISDASGRLQEIPDIARSKKWSQVQGILTGPLGTLLQTMNQLSKDSNEAKKAGAKVKNDIIAIGQMASKKDEAGCIAATEAASRDLDAFLRIVY